MALSNYVSAVMAIGLTVGGLKCVDETFENDRKDLKIDGLEAKITQKDAVILRLEGEIDALRNRVIVCTAAKDEFKAANEECEQARGALRDALIYE